MGKRFFFIVLLFLAIGFYWAEEEGDESEMASDFLDLELETSGEDLYQTAPGNDGRTFFLLKQVFPSATSTRWDVEGLRPYVQVTGVEADLMSFIAKFEYLQKALVAGCLVGSKHCLWHSCIVVSQNVLKPMPVLAGICVKQANELASKPPNFVF